MIEKIEKIIETARANFALWVAIYRPWHGESHTTERNLSFQFAKAFLEFYKNGIVFMEVPFTVEIKEIIGGVMVTKKRSNHLDIYLHADDFDILVECKNIYAPSHIIGIVNDVNRMNENLIVQIHNRYRVKPVRTYGVIFAETWYSHIAEWWVDNTNAENKKTWQKNDLKLPTDWIYKKLEVCEDKQENKPNETLFWLYGVSAKELNGRNEK